MNRPQGRTLDQDLTRRLKEAALQAVLEGGIDNVNYLKLSEEIGTSRSSIYRRWASKQDLILDAFATVANLEPIPLSDSIVDDLTVYMMQNLAIKERALEDETLGVVSFWGRVLTLEVFPMYWDKFNPFHLDPAFNAVKRAIEIGQLPRDTDPALLLAPLTSFLIFRMVLSTGEERRMPSEDQVRELVRSMCSDPPRLRMKKDSDKD